MRMNTALPLANQQPDFMRNQLGAVQMAGAMKDMQRQNRLAELFQQHGPGIMQGDQNALNALGQVDPGMALEVSGRHQAMAIDQERLALARQQAEREAQQFAAQASAQEVAQAQAEMRNRVGQLAAVRDNPQRYGEMAQQFGVDPDPANFPLVVAEHEAFDQVASTLEIANGQNGFRQATPEEAQDYGAQAGQFGPDGRFYPINPPSGMSLRTTPDGGVEMVQGPGAGGKFTESQSKDNVYATRARGSLDDVQQHEQALTNLGDAAAGAIPFNLGNYAQSEEYQLGRNAGLEFLQAILRKDTGAAITSQEQEEYGRVYLPQPGDKPATIARKREARIRAVNAIESGMSPEQMLAQERALLDSSVEGAASTVERSNAPPPTAPTQSFLSYPTVAKAVEAGADPQSVWDNLSDDAKREFLDGGS